MKYACLLASNRLFSVSVVSQYNHQIFCMNEESKYRGHMKRRIRNTGSGLDVRGSHSQTSILPRLTQAVVKTRASDVMSPVEEVVKSAVRWLGRPPMTSVGRTLQKEYSSPLLLQELGNELGERYFKVTWQTQQLTQAGFPAGVMFLS